MKKILASILALMMVASMSVTAFAAAEPITNPANGKGEGGYAIGVDGKYQAGTTVKETISVDISWEKMEFTYTGGGSSYSPDTHKTTTTAGSWNTNKKYIEVKNHSNVDITADFTFTQGDGVTTTGSFYDKADATTALDTGKQSFDLVSGEDKTTEGETYTVPSGKIYFGVSGDAIDADKALGTITVSIGKVQWLEVAAKDAFEAALQAGGKVKLGGNINMGDDYANINKSVTIDLNGHTLSAILQIPERTSDDIITITVKDSSTGANGKIFGSVWLNSQNDEMIVESGMVQGEMFATIVNSNGKVTVTGGSIVSSDGTSRSAIDTYGNGSTFIIGGTVSGTLNIAGNGTFSITGGTFSNNPTKYVDTKNYTVTEAGGKYTVTKK